MGTGDRGLGGGDWGLAAVAENPVAGEADYFGGAPLGVVKGGAIAVRQVVVVDGEAAVEAEAGVEDEGADERAGAITGVREPRRQRRRMLVEA